MLSPLFRRPRYVIAAAAVLVCALIAAGVYVSRRHTAPPEMAFSEFLQQVDRSQVKQIRFAEGALTMTLTSGAVAKTVPPPSFLAADSTFITNLARRGVRVEVQQAPEPGALTPASVAIAAFFLALIGFTVYRTTAGRIHTPGRAKQAERGGLVVTFQDVAGVDEAKDEVKEIVDFLKEPERFSSLGGRIPKGVLLIGPPGTGKTLLARSIAGEAGVPFMFASGSDFVEMYAGVGAARVRRLFKDARRHKSCIIFIDELDAVGRSRGGSSLSHEEREQILRIHARKVAVDADVDLRQVARGTPGFSGADLANLMNEAALAAGRDGRDRVVGKDMEAARDKVLMGVERRSVALSELDRVNCAYHEAGHAVAAALLPMADPLHKVTIIPRGRAMGVTMQLPEADRHTYTKGYLETQIAVLMGGRVAEELFMNHMTSGASNDIERATDIAQHMVCEWGMSALGMRAFRKAGNAFDADKAHAMSEATARRVDDEIEKIINGGYDRAYDLLNRNRDAVKAIAEALLEHEALDAAELKAILSRAGAGA